MQALAMTTLQPIAALSSHRTFVASVPGYIVPESRLAGLDA